MRLLAAIVLTALAGTSFDEESIVFRQDPDTLEIPADTSFTQTFQVGISSINAVTIFTRAQSPPPALTATLAGGGSVRRSRLTSRRYPDSEHAVTFHFPTLKRTSPTTLTLTVSSARQPYAVIVSGNAYTQGQLAIAGVNQGDFDSLITLRHPAPAPASIRAGLLAAVVFILGLVIVRGYLTAGLLLAVVTILALLPLYYGQGQLGISDWDYYSTYFTGLRRSVLEFHQFPLWNPWLCGGTSALGDPEFPVISWPFLLVLLFGVVPGLKLSVLASQVLLGWGVLALTARLKLSPKAGLIAALPIVFGSALILKATEGHIVNIIFSWAYFTWILVCWLSAYRERSHTNSDRPGARVGRSSFVGLEASHSPIICGILLALMFFQGGIYPLFYLLLVFIALILFVPHRKPALAVTMQAGLWALGFSAVKLIPVVMWLGQFPDAAYGVSTNTLPFLSDILFRRLPHGAADILPSQGGGWHEYGAYIGVTIFAMALLGLTQFRKRIVASLIIGTIAALLLSSAGPQLAPVFNHLSLIPRSYISRLILLATFGMSLLAAFGFETMRRRGRTGYWLTFAALALAALELLTVASIISAQTFPLPASPALLPSPPWPAAATRETFAVTHQGAEYTRAYLAARQGYGTLAYCSVLSPPPSIAPVEEGGTSVATLTSAGTAELISWTPNRVTIKTQTEKEATLALQTNYAPGWSVNDQPAIKTDGRVATAVPTGQHLLNFKYKPPGITVGLIISLGTIITAILILIRLVDKPH